MKIATIIINYNSGKYIFDCINSVKKQSLNTQIIVIDNYSNDNSYSKLNEMANNGQIIYQYMNENIGSSAANNIGINMIEADAYLILNADIILTTDYIKNCAEELLINNKTGAVVGKFLNYYNKDIIDGCGVDLHYECIPSERGSKSKNSISFYAERENVFAVCCAAALYRKTALNQIIDQNNNYFDQNYFAFYEDLDLSFRLLLSGFDNIYIPKAIAYHVRGGSTGNQSEFVKYLCLLNADIFYLKYLRPYIKYRFYRTFLILHRLIIYEWKLLYKVSEDLKKINLDRKKYDEHIKNTLSLFIKESYYKNKIKKLMK